jgi:hypothetical protein
MIHGEWEEDSISGFYISNESYENENRKMGSTANETEKIGLNRFSHE